MTTKEKWRDKKKYARYYLKNRERILLKSNKYYHSHKEYYRKLKLESQRKFKLELISLLGGKCSKCGYDKCIGALEFHHLDPKDKENKNEPQRQKFLEKIKARKIQLLCSNCHKETRYDEEN